MRRHWRISAGIAVVCLLIGIGVAQIHKTQTTAEARLAVGSQDLSAYQVAGFAQASEELAADLARYVNNSSASQDALKTALGKATSKVVSISASPIPNSDVISVEVTATDRAVAVKGAQAIAAQLQQQTSPTSPSASSLLASYTAISTKVAKQQLVRKAADNAAAAHPGDSGYQTAAANAAATLATLTEQQTAIGLQYQAAVSTPAAESALTIIQNSAVLSNDKRRTEELYGIGGLIVGLLIGLAWSTRLERQRALAPPPPAPDRGRHVAWPTTPDHPASEAAEPAPADDVASGAGLPVVQREGLEVTPWKVFQDVVRRDPPHE